jgi:hypothetical protein
MRVGEGSEEYERSRKPVLYSGIRLLHECVLIGGGGYDRKCRIWRLGDCFASHECGGHEGCMGK